MSTNQYTVRFITDITIDIPSDYLESTEHAIPQYAIYEIALARFINALQADNITVNFPDDPNFDVFNYVRPI